MTHDADRRRRCRFRFVGTFEATSPVRCYFVDHSTILHVLITSFSFYGWFCVGGTPTLCLWHVTNHARCRTYPLPVSSYSLMWLGLTQSIMNNQPTIFHRKFRYSRLAPSLVALSWKESRDFLTEMKIALPLFDNLRIIEVQSTMHQVRRDVNSFHLQFLLCATWVN